MGPIHIDGPASLPYDIDLGPLILSDYYYKTADEIVLAGGAPPPSDNILYVQPFSWLSEATKFLSAVALLLFVLTEGIFTIVRHNYIRNLAILVEENNLTDTVAFSKESTAPSQIPLLVWVLIKTLLLRPGKDID